MSRKFLTAVDLVQNELQNARVQNLGSAPSSPVKGQLYFNSTGGDNTLYWFDGTVWVAAKSGAGLTPASTVTTQAVGDAPVVGVATAYAREDHKHGREAFGNVTAQTTFGGSSGNGSAVSLARSDHTHGTPVHDAAAHSAIPINSLAGATGIIDMNGFKITEVGTPTADTDAANKGYVDNAIAGLSWKDSVRLSGAVGFDSPLSGTGVIDGVIPNVGDRVLMKTQSTPSQNGIWIVASGSWTRATDADLGTELVGAAVYVEEGTTNADTAWVQTVSPVTINVTGQAWAQFAGGGAVTAGAGMTQSGNTLNVIAADGSIVVGADAIQRGAFTGGDVTAAAGSATLAIQPNKVTNAMLYQMPAYTFKGNDTAGAANAKDLTSTEMRTALAGVFMRRFSQTVGDGSAVSFVITHGLNWQWPIVKVYRSTTPWDEVECDVEGTSTGTVTLRFNVAPTTNQYTVMVVA